MTIDRTVVSMINSEEYFGSYPYWIETGVQTVPVGQAAITTALSSNTSLETNRRRRKYIATGVRIRRIRLNNQSFLFKKASVNLTGPSVAPITSMDTGTVPAETVLKNSVTAFGKRMRKTNTTSANKAAEKAEAETRKHSEYM